MSERVTIALQDLDRAASVARTLKDGDALGALCYDVLGRQAEGRGLFSGSKFVNGRANAHGVNQARADTPLGNLLPLLKRGPESDLERALVAALFMRGFAGAVAARPAERKALCERHAAHCDWLELSSPYRVLPLLDLMLEPDLASDVLRELGQLVLREDDKTVVPAVRARNAGRISALSQSSLPAARAALDQIKNEAQDSWSVVMASVALGRTSTPPARDRSVELRGRPGRFPRGALRSLLRWVSGWALLIWIARVVLLAVGFRREAEVALYGNVLRVRVQTSLLGRLARSSEQVHALSALRSAKRAARYPSLPLVLGAICFALGVLLGGLFAFDAARVGDRALWLGAAAFALGGSALDLLFEVVIPGHRGRVVLDVDMGRGQGVRLAGVTIDEADQFLSELAQTVSIVQGGRRGVA
jgi:hypothetical protein